jgi:adenylate cyclase
VFAPFALELEARVGRVEEGLALTEDILADISRHRDRWHEAELRRIRGEALSRSAADPARAEQELRAAIAIAHEQGARAFALRAALSLAKLYHSTGRFVEAHPVLAAVLEGFSPTPEMPEIAEATALMQRVA